MRLLLLFTSIFFFFFPAGYRILKLQSSAYVSSHQTANITQHKSWSTALYHPHVDDYCTRCSNACTHIQRSLFIFTYYNFEVLDEPSAVTVCQHHDWGTQSQPQLFMFTELDIWQTIRLNTRLGLIIAPSPKEKFRMRQTTAPSFYSCWPLSILTYKTIHVHHHHHQDINTHRSHSSLKSRQVALCVASCLKQLDDDGLMRLQCQCVKRRRPQTTRSCAAYKHSGLRQAGGPGGIQRVRLGPDVQQNEEVNTTPGA